MVSVQGSAYLPSSPAIALAANTLTIADADGLNLPLVFNVAVSNNNVITKLPGGPANTMVGSINRTTGVLTIRFQPTGLNVLYDRTAVGAVLQNTGTAGGAFSGFTNTGSIYLQ